MDVLDLAVKLAREAGSVVMEHFNTLKASEIELKAKNDYVTDVDKLSEKIILSGIRERFPDHSIVAEESGSQKGNGWKWYVDPIDGTKNFIHGLPFFCISIGIELNGELVAGVINAPKLREEFIAEKGSSATCNGKRITVSSRNFSESMIATGFPFKGKDRIDSYLECFKDVFMNVSGIRRCGSAALDLAYTAKGVFDGFWEMSLHPWDIAAGTAILLESGGIVTDFDGKGSYLKSGNIVGAQPKVHRDLLNFVKMYLGGKNGK